MISLITTFFYVGHMKPAPGTWGSAAAVLVGYLLYGLGGPWLLLIGTIVAAALGFWAVPQAVASDPTADPSEIVIDEVVGQWIALLPSAFLFQAMGLSQWHFPWPALLGAFLFFRLYDIRKPWLVGKADRRHDPVGIMLDDIWAGIFAAISVVALGFVFHEIVKLIVS